MCFALTLSTMLLLFVDDNYQVDGQHYCRRLGSQATSLRSQEIIEVMHPETGTSRIIRECFIHPYLSLMQTSEPSPSGTKVHCGTFVLRYKSSRLDRHLPVGPSPSGRKVYGVIFASRCKSSLWNLCLPVQMFTVKPVLNWANVCSPEHTSDTSTNYDSFLN